MKASDQIRSANGRLTRKGLVEGYKEFHGDIIVGFADGAYYVREFPRARVWFETMTRARNEAARRQRLRRG